MQDESAGSPRSVLIYAVVGWLWSVSSRKAGADKKVTSSSNYLSPFRLETWTNALAALG